MNTELLEALNILEKEKSISKDTLLEAIEQSLIQACKNHFGKADNIKVNINPETCDFSVFAEKTVVEEVQDPVTEISLADARNDAFPICTGRCGKCRSEIQTIWTYCYTECEKCDSSENP